MSSSSSSTYTIFYGAVINPKSLEELEIFPQCLLAVDTSGNIDWIQHNVEHHAVQHVLTQKGHVDVEPVNLKDGQFIIPGFIDTHTHACQVPAMGTGGQYQLLDWLEKLVFPIESNFWDNDYAHTTYKSVVRRVIDSGTTTCCYYGSLHVEATEILADVIHSAGQRAFVGKCNMNRGPDGTDYIEKCTEESVEGTHKLIRHIHKLSGTPHANYEPLVQPILTPRFAISCTEDLLSELGRIAEGHPRLRIQTHISENKKEVAQVAELFPGVPNYASVYDKFNLLRHNTILGHAVHLKDEEMDLIKERNAGISHCPTSNFNLNSGIAPVGVFLDKGIKVGLGTDVSGGYQISILNTIQNANIAAKVRAMEAEKDDKHHHHHHHHHHHGRCECECECEREDKTFTNKPLKISTLLYLATLGGAAVCDLEKHVGSFAAGKSFDALLVDVRDETGNIGLWGGPDPRFPVNDKRSQLEVWLEKFLLCGNNLNISRVYVQGKLIGGRSFTAND